MKKYINKIIYDNRGTALMMTLLILSGVLIVALGAADLIVPQIKLSRIQEQSTKAYFASEAGAERSLWEVRKNTEFAFPIGSEEDIFFEDLSNGSLYNVDYASSTGNVTFTSVGNYSGAQRSVEIMYLR